MKAFLCVKSFAGKDIPVKQFSEVARGAVRGQAVQMFGLEGALYAQMQILFTLKYLLISTFSKTAFRLLFGLLCSYGDGIVRKRIFAAPSGLSAP